MGGTCTGYTTIALLILLTLLLTPSAPMSKSLALWAFESLNSKLNPKAPHISLSDLNLFVGSSSADYPSKAPLFITWNKKHNLRGCIGTFQSSPTESGVANYALVSAFEDTRFPAISVSELPLLSASVTLLDKFEPISDASDWTVGKHGLKVRLNTNGRHYLGTFLPLVAEEQEWDKKETLWNLLRKAGFSGVSELQTLDFYRKGLAEGWIELTRYEGLKSGAEYAEYAAARKALCKAL